MKLIKKIYIIAIIACSHLTDYSCVSYAQKHSIGFLGGYNAGKFLNFSIDPDYSSKYSLKSGFSLASFYETKDKPAISFRVGLQYSFQKADIEASEHVGHSSFYTKSDYSFHLLALNFNLVFQLVNQPKLKFNLLVGPEFSYIINTKAKGEGWTYYSASTGTKQYWEKDERNSKDLYKFNVGVNLGLEFIIPVREQLDFLIQNRYTILITSISKIQNIGYTSLLTASLQVGLQYNLKK